MGPVFAKAMAGATSAHHASAKSREQSSQQRAGRTRRTSADPQRAQQRATATASAPAALDTLRRLQHLADASHRVAQLRRLQALADGRFAPAAQLPQAPRANNTALPDQLKSGIESLPGLSMEDVRVHNNSAKPAQLNALAYVQDSDIHLAPGQEDHQPHEAWHVVQQAQERLQPTAQLKGGIPTNDHEQMHSDPAVTTAGTVQRVIETRLDTKFYRRKGGSASRRANDAIEEYNKLDQADTQKATDKLEDIKQLLSHVNKSKKATAEKIMGEIEEEKKRLGVKRKDMIMSDYKLKCPSIVYRYDSRPITMALEKGFVAQDPSSASITEQGENQSMVGGAHNFVGSYNYKGYAMINAHEETKKGWRTAGKKTFYWTAAVIRNGGMTYEWLLAKIPDENDRQRVRQLVMQRTEGTHKVDEELKKITDKHKVTHNIGTTEIVTECIHGKDILGYWTIEEAIGNKNEQDVNEPKFTEVRDLKADQDFKRIPEDDVARYLLFKETKGKIKSTTFL